MILSILKSRLLFAHLTKFAFSNQPSRQSNQLNQQYEMFHKESCRQRHGKIFTRYSATEKKSLPPKHSSSLTDIFTACSIDRETMSITQS